ncbi:MAG: FHA domain-containing protein [Gemmataceae bacterium]
MSLVGLDMNATRARAVTGPALHKVALLRLEGEQVELPLAVSLEEKQLRVGKAGLALVRARPHLACLDFLPFLGAGRVWTGGVHRLDADRAVEVTLAALARLLGRSAGIGCVLPAYLEDDQRVQLYRLAERARLPLLASLPAPVAAALGASLPGEEEGLVLVVDVDGHAMTWSIVERLGGRLRLRLVQPATHLARGLWLRRLLDGAAARCVRQSRRDPRDSAITEQSLYEQLAAAISLGEPRLAQLHIQGTGWFFHLMLHPDEMAGFVAPLLRQTLAELDAILVALDALGSLAGVVVTHAAAGLPGLVALLQARLQLRQDHAPLPDENTDYGESLLRVIRTVGPLCVLPVDTPACVAHELAVRVHQGDFPPGHLDSIALSGQGAPTEDAGPPRLSFRGQDHVLSQHAFLLGRDPACDLVFESELYPHVSGQHCEIVFDQRSYVLRDRSRHGTLVNDRPVQQTALHSGDWIRLGPRGPVLRFLGESLRRSPARREER